MDWTKAEPGMERFMQHLNTIFTNEDYDLYMGMRYDQLDGSMYRNEYIGRLRRHFEKQTTFKLDEDNSMLFNLDYLLHSYVLKS